MAAAVRSRLGRESRVRVNPQKAAAVFWGLTLARLSRPTRDLTTTATLASLAAYLLFGGINFGVWQEWWLGLGGLVAILAILNARAAAAAQLST